MLTGNAELKATVEILGRSKGTVYLSLESDAGFLLDYEYFTYCTYIPDDCKVS